ncbi:PAS domain S-box protein [Rhodovulum sp. 12E13]|nr:PAS domain S-box protein [Rhodovulum sp. 12E13]
MPFRTRRRDHDVIPRPRYGVSIPWGHGMDLSAPVGHPAAELLAENFDPAVLIDAGSGRFLAANGAARELLGFSSEELADMTPADIHPHEIARLEGFMANVRREGRWSSDELSCRTRDGRTVPALLRARMMGREDGGDAVLIVIRDQRERQLAALGLGQLAAGETLLHRDEPGGHGSLEFDS